MTPRFSQLVETDLGAGRFADSPLRNPPPIGAADASTEGVRFERVLVPLDLSTNTVSVLNRARTLAYPGSMIRVLHAVQLNIAGEERGIARTDLIHQLQETAREELRKLVKSLWANATTAAVIIREGCPKDVILQEACASNADLIVMGAHQHVGWRRVLHRNTAAYVIRHTSCPVLVVRP
jgi:nucleotide-binding universal stress UspA family protein